MDLPPRGVGRIAAVWPYIPDGGKVQEIGEWSLKIYGADGVLAAVISYPALIDTDELDLEALEARSMSSCCTRCAS